MKIAVVAVGRARGAIGEATAEYEKRVRRYFPFETAEVKEFRSAEVSRVREEEGKRLLARVASGAEVVALDVEGELWSSERLAAFLAELALRGSSGVAFLVGGAHGHSPELLGAAATRLSLSAFTLPHELARLVLTEQIYRACTIIRGEPYHK